jgi:two-component system, chemotaxis family, protein-glutamate methylesterase/glutaminase
VVGTARNGREALQKVHRLDPDVVTLDVEMPEVDGLQALGYIMSETPRPVVMLSAHTREGGEHTLRALDYGAVDFVAKPSGTVSRDVDRVAERLIDALRAATQADLRNLPVRVRPVPGPPLAAAVDTAAGGPATACVVVAASTGGPRALVELFAGLRLPQEVAVLTVQHMPGGFTRSLAGRLNAAAHLAVAEGEQAGEVRGGRAYLAPGGFHMRVEGRPPVARLVLGRDASIWGFARLPTHSSPPRWRPSGARDLGGPLRHGARRGPRHRRRGRRRGNGAGPGSRFGGDRQHAPRGNRAGRRGGAPSGAR